MHFIGLKERLLSAVLVAERLVGKKESLPVLSCVLLEVVGDTLFVRATNLEAGVNVQVSGDVHKKGIIAVPSSVFSQTLRSLISERVELKVREENLLVESKGSKTLIKAVPHEEFPTLTAPSREKKGQRLSRTLLLQGLQSVAYAASPSMIRPELGSVYVSLHEGDLTCVATDSFRLAEKTILRAAKKGEREVLIPLKHTLELVHILERTSDEEVSLLTDESQLIVCAEGIEFVSRVIDAPFPDYKEIIPKKFSTELTVLKNDFADTLRKARVFSGTEQRIGLHVYPKKKTLDATAQSAQVGEMSDSIDAALYGEDIDINFHIGYLADCLSVIESDSITLGFAGPGKPLVIRGASDRTFTYLVMPLNR